jgi:hypothetical protein
VVGPWGHAVRRGKVLPPPIQRLEGRILGTGLTERVFEVGRVCMPQDTLSSPSVAINLTIVIAPCRDIPSRACSNFSRRQPDFMWLQPLSAALGPHFAWSHAKNLVSQVHLHLVDGRLPEPSRAVRFSSDQSSSVDVQDLFEDQRRMPVPQLAAGLSVYGARGWPRRGCPRTPRWSERRGWPSGVRASASERCPRERQRAVSCERQRAGELAQRASHTLIRREHGLFLEKITIVFFLPKPHLG